MLELYARAPSAIDATNNGLPGDEAVYNPGVNRFPRSLGFWWCAAVLWGTFSAGIACTRTSLSTDEFRVGSAGGGVNGSQGGVGGASYGGDGGYGNGGYGNGGIGSIAGMPGAIAGAPSVLPPPACDDRLAEMALTITAPLFVAGQGETFPPIVFTTDDGVIVTRGAGRIHGRHWGPQETNEPFATYPTNYFTSRSYGFLVEDFTHLGESRVRVTYLPQATPESTELHAFKSYSNGDVFTSNDVFTMLGDLPDIFLTGRLQNYPSVIEGFAVVEEAELIQNSRTFMPITLGELFEFEIAGRLIELPPDSTRTSYFSDTFRIILGQGGLTPNNADDFGIGTEVLGPEPSAQLGGATTNAWVFHHPELYFSDMALNIQHEHVLDFLTGRRLFHTDFATGEHVGAPEEPLTDHAGQADAGAAGSSCEGCHSFNGRGLRLQEPQVSDRIPVQLADGTTVTLTKPTFDVAGNTGNRPFLTHVAPALIGLGLLEAIPEAVILANADPLDCNQDGITGRPSVVIEGGAARLGRFGWKGNSAGLEAAVAGELLGNIGVGTAASPDVNGDVELSEQELAQLVTYARLLAVPAQRNSAGVERGKELFSQVGCGVCHISNLPTSPHHPFRELQEQRIAPFTDLLLHDMGPDLAAVVGADVTEDLTAPAAASEWRTPPLWGIGLHADVNGRASLLHDGRAADVLEAILWHGGEAEGVRQRFIELSTEDRAALLEFVNSL